MVPDLVTQTLVKITLKSKDDLSRLEEYLFSRSGHHHNFSEDIMAKRQRKKTKQMKPLHVIQPNAAGIDIGATEIYVAVPNNEHATVSVRCFATFTEDLINSAKWMKDCGIKTVAMESTGVYWIPVFQILEAYGFEVALVNARHVKNVPGRKTDVQDCQWLQYLHSVGLLRGSYRPDVQYVLF
jgi:hypothetical protein